MHMSENSDSGAPPIFMFGHDRSGTTLLSMIVGAHPEIAVPLATTGLWYRFAGKLDQYNDLATSEDVARLVDDLCRHERIQLWDAPISRDEVLAELPTGSFPAVVRRFHECYARHHDKPRWGNIDIATLDHMDTANAWFPDAKFVHIVRDGRDVALSNQTMPFGVGNIAECAESWRNRLYANLKMGAVLGPSRYHLVHYEDLILNTTETLERMCQFLEVEVSSAMLEYTRMVDSKIPEKRRYLWPELDQALQASKTFRWRREMGINRRIVVEDLAGDMLRRLGYETFDRPPKRLLAHLLGLWYFVDRGGRTKRLLRRLGIRRKSRLERAWKKRSKT